MKTIINISKRTKCAWFNIGFVFLIINISLSDLFSQTYSVTLNTTKRGYATSTYWEWVTSDMYVGYINNIFPINNIAQRAFAWFDIPSELKNAIITSVELTVQVKDISKWNDLLSSVDLYTVDIPWNNFHNSTFGSPWDDGHWIMLDGLNNIAYINKTSSKTFALYPSLLKGKSELGFSFRAYPETRYSILGNQTYDIILNNPILIIKYFYPSLDVNPDNQTVLPVPGSTIFNLSSNTNWSITENASWLTVSSTEGSNDGTLTNKTLTVNYSSNYTSNSRSATITASGNGVSPHTFTLTQEPVYLNVFPNSKNIGNSSGSISFDIDCNVGWSVATNDTWLTAFKMVGGTFGVNFNKNSLTNSRTASITVTTSGGFTKTVTVIQSGEIAKMSVSPANLTVSSASGMTGNITVKSNISWSILENVTWLTISPLSGSGDRYVTVLTNSANTSTLPRSGTITFLGSGVSSQTISIIQSGITNSPPDKPTLLTPSNGNTVTIPFRMSWQCTDPDVNDILNYTLKRRAKGTTAWTVWGEETIGTKTYFDHVAQIDPDIYEWCVTASDGKAQNTSDIWEFTINSPPNKPVLLTPTNGNPLSNLFKFSWQCSDPDLQDVLNYTLKIRIKGTSSWNSNSINTQTSYEITEWDDSDLNVYEWCIIASDGKAETASNIWEFTLNEFNKPPNMPILLSPINGSSVIVPFRFSWICTDKNSNDILNYKFKLRIKGTTVWNEELLGTQTYFDIISQVNPNTYEWCIVANDEVAETSSAIGEFTVLNSNISVSPNNQDVGSNAGSTTFNISSNTSWTLSNNATWLTLSSVSGSGNRTITATYTANTLPNSRVATITVSGLGVSPQIVTVTQSRLLNSPPDKPTLLTPSNASNQDNSFTISWKCSDPDVNDVLSYLLRIRVKGTSIWEEVLMNNSTSYTISDWIDSDLNTYEWCVVASDGNAVNTSAIWEFTLTPLSNIIDVFKNIIIKIYPNPTRGILNIDFDIFELNVLNIEIIDMKGIKVYSKTIKSIKDSYKEQINISDKKSGVYIVKVKSGNNIYYQQVLVD